MNILRCVRDEDCICCRDWWKQMRDKLQKKRKLSQHFKLHFLVVTNFIPNLTKHNNFFWKT